MIITMNYSISYSQIVISNKERNNAIKSYYCCETYKLKDSLNTEIINDLLFNILNYKTIIKNDSIKCNYKDSIILATKSKFSISDSILTITSKRLNKVEKYSKIKNYTIAGLSIIILIILF